MALAVVAGVAHAAELVAVVDTDSIAVGGTASVGISLELGPAEQASLFEGVFELNGLGTVANAALAPGGPSWGASFGNIIDDTALVSLISSNAGGDRLVATFTLTGVAPGSFEIRVGSPAPLAGFDIATPPYIQSVPVSPGPGALLATVTITDVTDTDGDGIGDDVDNCLLAANADQRDSNADGFGNRCDADINDDCLVNFGDLGLFRERLFGDDPDADLTGDGNVNFADLAIASTQFFGTPGPSAVATCP